MRRLLTYLAAAVLLLASLAIGAFTADLPFWRRAFQWPLPVDALYLPVATIGKASDATPQMPREVATPVGMVAPATVDAGVLDGAARLARESGSRALLIARHGEVIAAFYFGADDDHALMPAGLIARPVAAMAVGVALAEGHLASLDAPVAGYLPEWDSEPRGRVTLRQLLQETSGLEAGGDVPGLMRRSPLADPARLPEFATAKGVRILLGNDFARAALRFDLQHEPGGFFTPSPANAQLAALIVERATATPYERYIEQRLWRASGAGHAELALDRRAGMPSAHCCWRAAAPDILRLVSLLASDGKIHGRQVLPPGWAGEMSRASRVNPERGMHLTRLEIAGRSALSAADADGSAFWVIPDGGLAILNIVKPAGSSPAELPALLLSALATD